MAMRHLLLSLCAALLVVSAPSPAFAHCDTMDGPVVAAGQKALTSGDLELALIWIKPEAESELRAAFEQAVQVRKESAEARALADQYFLETLVRLHRAGEGMGFTGIRPAGTVVNPAIPLADTSITSGNTRPVEKLLTDATRKGLQQRFERVRATRNYKPTDVAAGREHVDAYVVFMHYAENVYEAAAGPAGHGHPPDAAAGHAEH